MIFLARTGRTPLFASGRSSESGLTCISHHLTAQARDRPAITSLRLLAVLNALWRGDVKSPGDYLDRFFYDTIVHDADSFEFSAKILGSENILYGTDYPFDMGNLGPAKDIPGLSRLPESDREKILFENAKKVFGI